MTTTIIVLAVVAFLAVDGYIIYRVLRARSRADKHGSFAVPGALTLALGTGRVKLTYQESFRAPNDSSGEIDFGVPSELQLEMLSPSGEALEVKGPGLGGTGYSLSRSPGHTRALVGTVQITEAGEHKLSAQGTRPAAVKPEILVGA